MPVLLVIDGIDKDERHEIRRIVLALQGRMRTLITIDKESLQDQDQSVYNGLNNFVSTITVPPLTHTERKHIFEHLIVRIGLKKMPPTSAITDRQAAGSPLYLQTVAAYIIACGVLASHPESLASLGTHPADIIANDFLPMIERRVGVPVVKHFVEILLFDPLGHERKEIATMLHACGVQLSDASMRMVMEVCMLVMTTDCQNMRSFINVYACKDRKVPYNVHD